MILLTLQYFVIEICASAFRRFAAAKGLVQREVWRQAGCCLVGHFAGFWKFASHSNFCEPPPQLRQAGSPLQASRLSVQWENEM